MNNILVSTPVELEFATASEPLVLLGEWCRIYGDSRTSNGAVVLPYHWDDREKAERDFHYLHNLKYAILPSLAAQLNYIHTTNYSVEAWNIMVGYWLTQFLAVAFDRWTMLEVAQKNYENLVARGIEADYYSWVPKDTVEAGNQFFEDSWNHVFIGQLIRTYTSIPFEIIEKNRLFSSFDSQHNQTSIPFKGLIKKRLYDLKTRLYGFFLKRFGKKDVRYVFHAHYLSVKQLVELRTKLQGKFFVAPPFNSHWAFRQAEKDYRSWQLPQTATDFSFEQAVKELIPFWLPKVFLENFAVLQKGVIEIITSGHLPNKPAVIFTATGHYFDEPFKCFAAFQRDIGGRLVIGQHGGGTFHKFNGGLQLDLDLSDLYVTTGNGNKGYPHLRDVGQFFSRFQEGVWDPKGKLLLVLLSNPRYSYNHTASTIAGQILGYFEDQYTFLGELGDSIKSSTLVRLYHKDYGWKFKERLLAKHPDLDIDEGQGSIVAIAKTCRLFVSTYRATTYNESLAANIPTVIYWDKNFWEMPEWADEDFELLKSVGIFHETPESAAKHVRLIWKDVSNWWSADEVQRVRKLFCRKYAFRDPGLMKRLAAVLQEASSN